MTGPSNDPQPAPTDVPPNATPNYRALATNLQDLINALVVHPDAAKALDSNTSSDPSPQRERNKVYYLYDFCCRSRYNLLQIDPQLRSKQARTDFQDVLERSIFSQVLINDNTGKFAIMTGDDPSKPTEWGDEVLAAAEKIGNLPDRGAVYT